MVAIDENAPSCPSRPHDRRRHPADDLPLPGPMLSYVDRTALDFGMPLWLRQFVQLALLGVLAYLALRLIVRRIFR